MSILHDIIFIMNLIQLGFVSTLNEIMKTLVFVLTDKIMPNLTVSFKYIDKFMEPWYTKDIPLPLSLVIYLSYLR